MLIIVTYKIVYKFVIIKFVHLHQNFFFKCLHSGGIISTAVFSRTMMVTYFWGFAAFHSVANEENQGKCHGGLTSSQTTQQDNLHNSYTDCTRLYSLYAPTSCSHHNHNVIPSSSLWNWCFFLNTTAKRRSSWKQLRNHQQASHNI